MKFSEILKDLMNEKEIEVKDLAEKTKIDQSTIYGYFEDNLLLSTSCAIKLSNFFECSIDYLIGLTDLNEEVEKREIFNFVYVYEKLLKNNNTNNYALARELGFGKNRIYEWRKGRKPSIPTLIMLANNFNVSIEYLIGRVD